jgi:hypothetical protein
MGTVIQNQFEAFHDNIRLDANDNKEIIAKRNMLVDVIKAFIKDWCENKGSKVIAVENFNQGSYAMGTGVKPLHNEDDYDIDCGLLFDISAQDYTPIQVKQWVFDALDKKQFRTVEWKKACVRVQYTEQGLPKFHLDFACYSHASADGQLFLAKGKPTSPADQKKWEASEPKKLKQLVNEKFRDDAECGQFKRTIRYMKRWKDYQLDGVNGKPTGIAFTALAYYGFKPFTKNIFNSEEERNDLNAVTEFVTYILNQFSWNNRIAVALPVPPGNDLFAKMTDQQCKTLREKLQTLKDALVSAAAQTDPREACRLLQKQFGDDFPVPPKEETAQVRRAAAAGTSESA